MTLVMFEEVYSIGSNDIHEQCKRNTTKRRLGGIVRGFFTCQPNVLVSENHVGCMSPDVLPTVYE